MKYRETFVDILVDAALLIIIGLSLFIAGIFFGMNFGAW